MPNCDICDIMTSVNLCLILISMPSCYQCRIANTKWIVRFVTNEAPWNSLSQQPPVRPRETDKRSPPDCLQQHVVHTPGSLRVKPAYLCHVYAR